MNCSFVSVLIDMIIVHSNLSNLVKNYYCYYYYYYYYYFNFLPIIYYYYYYYVVVVVVVIIDIIITVYLPYFDTMVENIYRIQEFVAIFHYD